jgi:hypothetical protein
MELAETVAAILRHAPGEPLCDVCLAFACTVTVTEMRAVTERLVVSDSDFDWGSSCANCRRTVSSMVYREHSPKCAHCSRPIGPDPGWLMGGDRFHIHCLRRLLSDDTIRLSRALSRRSRELIEQSRRRIREGHGWSPLEPSA